MDHADTLTLLFPTELTGVFQDDTVLEGLHLDAAEASAELLLEEMFPDLAETLLVEWERVCGLYPGETDPLQARRDAIVRRLRERGGLSRQYFIDLAATYGWTITIDEFAAFRAGINRCGDTLYEEEVIWIWRVNVPARASYRFRTGASAAGERLNWWIPEAVLEALFEDVKPAHTYVFFNYTLAAWTWEPGWAWEPGWYWGE
jgi:uncharacterized protein YmfQ (DUF2313 family)